MTSVWTSKIAAAASISNSSKCAACASARLPHCCQHVRVPWPARPTRRGTAAEGTLRTPTVRRAILWCGRPYGSLEASAHTMIGMEFHTHPLPPGGERSAPIAFHRARRRQDSPTWRRRRRATYANLRSDGNAHARVPVPTTSADRPSRGRPKHSRCHPAEPLMAIPSLYTA